MTGAGEDGIAVGPNLVSVAHARDRPWASSPSGGWYAGPGRAARSLAICRRRCEQM
jgi:hypothetical protein